MFAYLLRNRDRQMWWKSLLWWHNHTVPGLSSYNTNIASKFFRKDLNHVLAQHRTDEIININKSILYFVNNQFYYQKNDEKGLITLSANNAIDNYSGIIRLRLTSTEIILKQISSNKIGFGYLSDTDLKFILTAIFSSIGTSYTISDVQQSLDASAQLIIGQSALHYCSLGRQNSSPSQPCLVISALFLRSPAVTTSIFSIYRLFPSSILFNGDKYVYSNLPKFIRINTLDQTIIMWSDQSDSYECAISTIVQCQEIRPSIPLSKTSCLS
jgi:hypothetical protein